MPYDVEKALRSAYADWLPAVRVLTELPAKLVSAVPLLRITREGGDRGYLGVVDNPLIVFDAIAASRADAKALALQARNLADSRLSGQALGDVTVGLVSGSSPVQVPYTDDTLRWFQFSLTFPYKLPEEDLA